MARRFKHVSGKAALVLAGVLSFAGGVASAKDGPEMARKIPDVKFEGLALSDAIEYIRDAGKLNITVDWKTLESAGIDRTTPVTFRLRAVTLRKALETVLREAGGGTKLAYEINDGVIEITTQEEADKKLTTEVYDIRDLMFAPINAGQAPELQFQLEATTKGGGGGGGGSLFGGSSGSGQQQDQTAATRGEEIVTLITSTIRPEVWVAAGGPASIRYFNGCLIVTAPRSVQSLIGIPIKP